MLFLSLLIYCIIALPIYREIIDNSAITQDNIIFENAFLHNLLRSTTPKFERVYQTG